MKLIGLVRDRTHLLRLTTESSARITYKRSKETRSILVRHGRMMAVVILTNTNGMDDLVAYSDPHGIIQVNEHRR